MHGTTRTTRTARAVGALLLTSALALGAVAIGSTSATAGPTERADDERPSAGGATRAMRNATERYLDVGVALADGYVPVSGCEASPGQGAMGIHYLHPGLAADSEVVPTKPEVLLYEPQADGELQLVGVEWFVADPDQDLTTDAGRPSAFGVPFDGPMPGHGGGMPVHFDLHAWVWRDNPSGTFAPWNPAVRCPSGGEQR